MAQNVFCSLKTIILNPNRPFSTTTKTPPGARIKQRAISPRERPTRHGETKDGRGEKERGQADQGSGHGAGQGEAKEEECRHHPSCQSPGDPEER